MLFSPDLFWKYIEFSSKRPENIPLLLFSYFGHLGVPLFIFLSGYGLTRSFIEKKLDGAELIKEKIFLIYKLMLITLLTSVFISIVAATPQKPVDLVWHMFKHAILIHNFSPLWYEGVGPWWFFDCILQLYLLFLPLFALLKKYGLKALLCLIGVCFIILNNDPWFRSKYGLHLYTLFVAYVPIFAIGIYFGQKPKIDVPLWLTWLGGVIFLFSNIFEAFFPLNNISFILISLPCLLKLTKKSLRGKRIFWCWLGTISPYAFGLNGILRLLTLRLCSEKALTSIEALLYAGLNLLLVIMLAWVVAGVVKFVDELLNKQRNQYRERCC